MTATDRAYGAERAASYEERSAFDKGDRAAHRRHVEDVLAYLGSATRFVDLGCGTGFFAETIFARCPDVRGVLVDASPDMLAIARRRLAGRGDVASFECCPMQDLRWTAGGTPDLAFSAMAFHFLDHDTKWHLFADLARVLPAGGSFILIDQFAPAEPEAAALLEYVACRSVQRALRVELGLDFDPPELRMDSILERDRMSMKAEGTIEASLDELVLRLRESGFASVQTFFQEHRIFGLLARKKKSGGTVA